VARVNQSLTVVRETKANTNHFRHASEEKTALPRLSRVTVSIIELTEEVKVISPFLVFRLRKKKKLPWTNIFQTNERKFTANTGTSPLFGRMIQIPSCFTPAHIQGFIGK